MSFYRHVKILDPLEHFSLCKFAQRIGIDPILTALAFYRCSGVDLEKTKVKDGLVFRNYPTGEVDRLAEVLVQA